ncbi:MAG: YceI family protein [marine benthic group bacterium]|nr:YceI family protein [Candidatus Carthagonibacter metallireducens]
MSTTTMTNAGTTTWSIDPQHSEVGFEVKHMMFAKVRGRFEEVEGTVVLGAGDAIENSRVEAEMQAGSINTGQAQRDEHLRSPDFFDVEQFPTLSFKSTSVGRGPDGDLMVTGDLTIHGVTREVELTVNETGRGTDPWGNERIGFNAETTVDRRDFDLTWNQALETGGVLVGTEVKIGLEIQAVRQEG